MATRATKTAEEAPAVVDTKYSKAEILLFPSWTGAQRDILSVTLSESRQYTYKEALKEADKFKVGGLF